MLYLKIATATDPPPLVQMCLFSAVLHYLEASLEFLTIVFNHASFINGFTFQENYFTNIEIYAQHAIIIANKIVYLTKCSRA